MVETRGGMETASSWWSCFVFVFSLYSLILVVSILCPAHLVEGYVCDPLWLVLPNKYEDYHPPHRDEYHKRIKPLKYSLNGFRCFCILVGGFLALHGLGYSGITLFLARNFDRCALISNLLGLLASHYFVYTRFPELSFTEQKANSFRRAPTIGPAAATKREDDSNSVNVASIASNNYSINPHNHCLDVDNRGAAFFYGNEFNPRWELLKPFLFHYYGAINGNEVHAPTVFILDVKMALYLIGAIVLELNVLSALLYERESRGTSNALLLYSTLMSWFVLDYLWYEDVHLYTYDIFAEKIGFKLLWGCLCFYPFFYCVGTLPFTATNYFMEDEKSEKDDLNLLCLFAIGLLYTAGSILTRGANLQKYFFRRYPHKRSISLFGGILTLKQETLSSSDHRILCSGFWGLARHVNYFGEIVQAVALALPGYLHYNGSSTFLRIAPWLYPLYYIALFIPRQIDDEFLMRQKYGDKVMDEYCLHVPHRIVPSVY